MSALFYGLGVFAAALILFGGGFFCGMKLGIAVFADEINKPDSDIGRFLRKKLAKT